jgi:acyl-CoA thioester hydrolase
MSHHLKVKIYYEDTDCGGVVYYANYLRYLERARTEFMEAKGLSLRELKMQGIQFVVRHVDIEYLSPCAYGDTLDIQTGIEKSDRLRIVFNSTIHAGDALAARAKVTLICINEKFKPVRIPDHIEQKLF